jgi:hypothetical protein
MFLVAVWITGVTGAICLMSMHCVTKRREPQESSVCILV